MIFLKLKVRTNFFSTFCFSKSFCFLFEFQYSEIATDEKCFANIISDPEGIDAASAAECFNICRPNYSTKFFGWDTSNGGNC